MGAPVRIAADVADRGGVLLLCVGSWFFFGWFTHLADAGRRLLRRADGVLYLISFRHGADRESHWWCGQRAVGRALWQTASLSLGHRYLSDRQQRSASWDEPGKGTRAIVVLATLASA